MAVGTEQTKKWNGAGPLGNKASHLLVLKLSMMARGTSADLTVVALVGDNGAIGRQAYGRGQNAIGEHVETIVAGGRYGHDRRSVQGRGGQ